MKAMKENIYHPVKKRFVPLIEFLEDSITDERLTLRQEAPFIVQLAEKEQDKRQASSDFLESFLRACIGHYEEKELCKK